MTEAKTPAVRKPAAKAPARKAPQDRKPKAAPVEGPTPDGLDYVRAIVVEGIALETTLEFMNDYEFAEAGADVEDGHVNLVPRLLRRAINDPVAYMKVKAHLRDENTGRIDLDRGAEFFGAFMSAVREAIEAEQAEAAE